MVGGVACLKLVRTCTRLVMIVSRGIFVDLIIARTLPAPQLHGIPKLGALVVATVGAELGKGQMVLAIKLKFSFLNPKCGRALLIADAVMLTTNEFARNRIWYVFNMIRKVS